MKRPCFSVVGYLAMILDRKTAVREALKRAISRGSQTVCAGMCGNFCLLRQRGHRSIIRCAKMLLLATMIASVAPCCVEAELRMPSLFGNHMVLQRDTLLPIWGWDEPGTVVSVELGETTVQTTAGVDGKWQAKLPAQKTGAPLSLQVTGTTSIRFEDVLIGEVWLCSGQSNMEWQVNATINAEREIASSDIGGIRYINVDHFPAKKPQTDVSTVGWQVSHPDVTGKFSAVGYYFARELHEKLGVPIGLIGSKWGGTCIETWIPPVGYLSNSKLNDIADNLDEYPRTKTDGTINHQSALALYNGMIHPLVPYGLRGVLWYQGESNRGDGMLYHEKMKALIAGWREVWHRPTMPFYYVQLAPYRYGDAPLALPEIWEAQVATLKVANTAMVVTTDIGNLDNIHPRNKQEVARRLCLCAMAKTYGQPELDYSGPMYKSMAVEGDRIRLFFEHAESGLVSRDGEPLSWFQIADSDRRQFEEASAEIEGNTIVVHAEGVKKPAAVRFGWHQEATPNLVDQAGLPASPFRTDDW